MLLTCFLVYGKPWQSRYTAQVEEAGYRCAGLALAAFYPHAVKWLQTPAIGLTPFRVVGGQQTNCSTSSRASTSSLSPSMMNTAASDGDADYTCIGQCSRVYMVVFVSASGWSFLNVGTV